MKPVLWMTTALIGVTVLVAVAVEQQDPPAPKRERPPLTADQRAQEEQVDSAWSKLPLREKLQMMKMQRAMRAMPPEERQFIHDRLERFITMSPEDREKLKKNHERWKTMTAEEKQRAREEFRKRRQAFEEKGRQEHPGQEPPPFPFRGPRNPPDQSLSSENNQPNP